MSMLKLESWRCKDYSYTLMGEGAKAVDGTPMTVVCECETLLLAFEVETWPKGCQMHETLMAVDLMRLHAIEICRNISAHCPTDMSATEALSHVSDQLLDIKLNRPILYKEMP